MSISPFVLKMNILFLTQIVPYPPDAGPKVKTWHVLRSLAGQGHSVTLISFARPEEMPHLPVLQDLCHSVHVVPMHRSRLADLGYMMKSFLTGLPFLVVRDDLPAMQALVDQLVRESHFDFIHADQLTMVQYALRSAQTTRSWRPKIIFDAHNAVWTIVERMQKTAPWYLRPLLGLEARRVKRYEGSLLASVDHGLAVTEVDKASLKEALAFSNKWQGPRGGARSAPLHVIPIAVDTGKLQPVQRLAGSRNIVTLGTLYYPPNADGIRWFMTEVFPLVRDRIPDATLTIIGKNPPRDFLEMQEKDPEAIKVTGYVPDLLPWFEKSSLMVVPVRAGGGMRVRILEAFAFAMPVVTTTVGLEGIQAMPGRDVLVADDPEEFAERTWELLQDPLLQESLARNGRCLAEDRYDWQAVLSAMRQIYE